MTNPACRGLRRPVWIDTSRKKDCLLTIRHLRYLGQKTVGGASSHYAVWPTKACATGALVQLFDITVPVGHAHWFVTPKGVEPTPLLKLLRQWVFGEVQNGIFNDKPDSNR